MSKTKRQSGGRIKYQHAAIMTSAGYMQTAIHIAFEIACGKHAIDSYRNKETPSKLYSMILKQHKRTEHLHPVGRGWSANLAPSTVKKLVAQGIFA